MDQGAVGSGAAVSRSEDRRELPLPGAPAQGGPSLLTKSISIYFGSGQSTLDANARKVLDRFAKTLAMFQNAFVQVEGNTDNVGNRTANVTLSKSRAEAVIAYLVERYRFDRSRFVAIGNGPDRPVADNQTNEGREQNRRTDFKLIKNVARVAPIARTRAPRPVGEGALRTGLGLGLGLGLGRRGSHGCLFASGPQPSQGHESSTDA